METQETPAGKGWVVRLYAYEEESNRTSETAREPGAEGKCAADGGTVERHTYDEANSLTDEGVEYETFGNTTKMPSGDAGGHEIVSTCSSAFEQEKDTSGLLGGNTEVAAWADISYCWGGGEVLSVNLKYQRERIKSKLSKWVFRTGRTILRGTGCHTRQK